MADCVYKYILCLFLVFSITSTKEVDKEQVDKVIEDEITQKLSEDLLQSIEKKFHVDLERSVDSVLIKIKLLLHNGTTHIQERLVELQGVIEALKKDGESEVDHCLLEYQNETTALAEKALHQMVVCGYALIGHDPAQAVRNVVELKAMIKHGLKPMHEQKQEVYNLLRVCGHEHDSLKKVIKCVISKSPQLKSAMMGVSGKLIDGVVHLTKQMAHGAMHEACLIEVINTVEDEAFVLVNKVKKCTTNNTDTVKGETEKYVKQNNATVLDVKTTVEKKEEEIEAEKAKSNGIVSTLISKIVKDTKDETSENMIKLQKELSADGGETNDLNDVKHHDK